MVCRIRNGRSATQSCGQWKSGVLRSVTRMEPGGITENNLQGDAVIFKIPSLPLANALATGWINIGNIWMFGGLLLMIKRDRRSAG